jgi:hypothetical protein
VLQQQVRDLVVLLHVRSLVILHQKTGSLYLLRIRDVYPGSQILLFSIPDPGSEFFHPGSRILIKEFKYFNPKNCFLSSRK